MQNSFAFEDDNVTIEQRRFGEFFGTNRSYTLGQLLQARVLMGLAPFALAGMLWLVPLGWAIHLWSVIEAARFKPRGWRAP